jgi:hypothetical protein
MTNDPHIESIFKSYWASMFDLLGWDYEQNPAPFDGWRPDFAVYGAKSVYVAVVPVREFPEAAMAFIDRSDCPYECLIVTEGTPIPAVNGSDFKYSLGWARSRDFRNEWRWHPALLARYGSRVILRHQAVDLSGLTDKPVDESAVGRWIQTKWEQAKAQATGNRLIVNPEEFEREKDFQSHIVNVLAPHFYVYTRARGRHLADGNIKRIDLIIKPINLAGWKDDDITFGVEFKNPRTLTQTNKITKWLGQCLDYANIAWEYSADEGKSWTPAGQIAIFTCPSLVESIPGSEVLNRWNNAIIPRLMAQSGIGELKPITDRGWSLVRNGDHVIWSELKGVEDGRKDSVQRRFGSR